MGTVFFNSTSELATVSNTFAVTGTPTDPTSVTLTVTSPAGVVTTPTPTHGTTGAYSADVTCNEAGTWQYTWVGTGAATDTVDGTWEVQETQLGRLYCTVEALKSRLNVTNSNSDLEAHGACFAASRWVEQHCERTFWRTASTEVRTFAPTDWWVLRLPEFNDLVSVTSILTDEAGDGTFETTWLTSDYQLLCGTGASAYNPQAGPETRPYTAVKSVGTRRWPWIYVTPSRSDRVQITGVFGWPAVPRAVKQAAQLLAAELFRRKDAPFGVAGEGEYVLTNRDNQMAKTLLGPYRRNSVLIR
jgi:hypothetical protein